MATPAGAADDLTQTDAQNLAAQANEKGSDQSLRSSATSAMRAIIQFGEDDIRGAFKQAYQAYGSFKTSENLDRARKQGIVAKAALGSVESPNVTEAEVAFLASRTSYRRLGSSALDLGDDAKVAEEFEKKTGIKRQEFLDMLAAASEKKLFVSDPELAEKVDAEFDAFVGKIRNAEFRAKVQRTLDLLPRLSRHKLLVKTVQKAVAVAKSFSPGSESDVTAAAHAPAEPGRAPAGSDGAEAKILGNAPSHAEEAAPDLVGGLNRDDMAKSTDAVNDPLLLDGVVKAAIHDDPESETVFEKISRRYRVLTLRFGLAKTEKAEPKK